VTAKAVAVRRRPRIATAPDNGRIRLLHNWRPPSAAAEDRNLDLFLLALQAVADVAPSSGMAEDRNWFGGKLRDEVWLEWWPSSGVAEDRNANTGREMLFVSTSGGRRPRRPRIATCWAKSAVTTTWVSCRLPTCGGRGSQPSRRVGQQAPHPP
jgi:hypothetical protein